MVLDNRPPPIINFRLFYNPRSYLEPDPPSIRLYFFVDELHISAEYLVNNDQIITAIQTCTFSPSNLYLTQYFKKTIINGAKFSYSKIHLEPRSLEFRKCSKPSFTITPSPKIFGTSILKQF